MSKHLQTPIVKVRVWVVIALAIFLSAEVGSAGAIIAKLFTR